MEISLLLTIAALWGCTYASTTEESLIDTAIETDFQVSNEFDQIAIFKNKYKQIRREAYRRQLHSQLLVNTLCAGGSLESKRIDNQIYMLFDEYGTPLIKDILHDAIESVDGCKSPSQLVDLLWLIYREDDAKSFELMLHAQLVLFQTIAKSQHIDDMDFQRKFAFTLSEIKQSKSYDSLNVRVKQQTDQAISQLPTNLQYLLFLPFFCLMNANYSEYIYTAMNAKNMDSTSRYIWVWYDVLSIDSTGHIKANVFESNNANTTELLVQLKGSEYGVFYYMMPQTKLIAGWDLTSEPMNYIWNIEFIDDERVAFYQGDYIMCSTDEKYDSERRQVRGYKRGSYTSKSAECQWLLGTCNRRSM